MYETPRLDTHPSELVVTASIQSDAGCIRGTNEDRGRYISPRDPDTLSARGRLTIVADGMGGHASGEMAAHMAVEIINERYYSNAALDATTALRQAIEAANASIYDLSLSGEQYAGMGTTIVALVIAGNMAFSAHVGDSRLYRMRERRLELLTTDHSHVMEMVHHGIITLDQTRDHDDKNIILRAVGTQPQVEIEMSESFEVAPGDTFLLCSDGLNDMLEDVEIETILRGEPDEYAACETLIAAAKEKGGHDNVTVGVVSVGGPRLIPREVRITREVEVF